ncbi:hypothetical protein [Streptomyces sp. NPDC059080]|uniref:hypothetical protein n=1 Tax=Streptomyces sp. NPDC059080 TaxID=3346718 RepID=UPI0036A6B1B0
MSAGLDQRPALGSDVLSVHITVQYDDNYQPWGEPEILAEETEKINNHDWAAYEVIARSLGPVEIEHSLCGCVVALTDTGTYKDAAEIPDAHLREVAQDLVGAIQDEYLEKLRATRAEIDLLIQRIEQSSKTS